MHRFAIVKNPSVSDLVWKNTVEKTIFNVLDTKGINLILRNDFVSKIEKLPQPTFSMFRRVTYAASQRTFVPSLNMWIPKKPLYNSIKVI